MACQRISYTSRTLVNYYKTSSKLTTLLLLIDQELNEDYSVQLLILIIDESSTSKSQQIQTITNYFKRKSIADLLVKLAYTEIATLFIDSKTTHTIVSLTINNHNISKKSKDKLTCFWAQPKYLIIISEMLMISWCTLVVISQHLLLAKMNTGSQDISFDRINVILSSDFHHYSLVTIKNMID